jgi:hypothetical protein
MAIIAMTTANVAVRPGRARVALGAASCENVLIVLRHRQPLVQANTRGRARREIVQSEFTGWHLGSPSSKRTGTAASALGAANSNLRRFWGSRLISLLVVLVTGYLGMVQRLVRTNLYQSVCPDWTSAQASRSYATVEATVRR